jgi:hypothetical protein
VQGGKPSQIRELILGWKQSHKHPSPMGFRAHWGGRN